MALYKQRKKIIEVNIEKLYASVVENYFNQIKQERVRLLRKLSAKVKNTQIHYEQSKMNNTSAQNHTFCYDIPIAVGNKTFCGLAERWKPRFNHGNLLAMTIIPVLVYWAVLFKMCKKLYKESIKVWEKEEDPDFENKSSSEFIVNESIPLMSLLKPKKKLKLLPDEVLTRRRRKNKREKAHEQDESAKSRYCYLEGVEELFTNTYPNQKCYCLPIKVFVEKCRVRFTDIQSSNDRVRMLIYWKPYFSIVILTLVKYFWDAIDLTLDVYIFYRLERGDVLDDVIYRNSHVNNAIYAFAILGCLIKIGAWRLYCSALNDVSDEEETNNLKYIVGLVGFILPETRGLETKDSINEEIT